MSYDLQIWSPAPLDLASRLPDPDHWAHDQADDQAVYDADHWSITATVAQPTPYDWVPFRVEEHMPNARHCIDLAINLDAPGAGYDFLVQVAQALARGRNALCYDPQSHNVLIHSGRLAQPGHRQPHG